jgi:stress response protein YsnF
MADGRTAISVYLEADQQSAEIEELLHTHGALDLFENDADSGDRRTEVPGSNARTAGSARQQDEEKDEHIPIVKEQLEVGKRASEQRYHVRVYPVTRDVEEKVNLRGERVVIERRPTEAYSPTDKDLVPREFEVVEHHEEPVVAKTATAAEEVVVSHDVSQRTETVRDTVKETKVEVDKRDSKDKRKSE